jgi:serine phosphatase RsbU (regulator of sigma subunit)/HAMP domain-containing protein
MFSLRFTLRTKLIFLSIFVVVLTMTNVTYFFTFRQVKDKRSDFEIQMRRIAENIATMHVVEQRSWTNYQNIFPQLMSVNEDIVYIAIYDDRNDLRACSVNRELVETGQPGPLSAAQEAAIVEQLEQGLVTSASKADLSSHAVNILSGDRVLGRVHVGFSLIEINDLLRKRIARNILVALFFIVLSSTVAYVLSRRISGPIEHLSQAMSAVARGQFQQRLVVENRDESGKLAAVFNEMAEGLQERRVIDDLSKELSKSFKLSQLIALFRNKIVQAFDAADVRLFLYTGKNDDMFEYRKYDDSETGSERLKLSRISHSYFSGLRDGIVLSELYGEHTTAFDEITFSPHELFMPMFVKNDLFGFLLVAPGKYSKTFSLKQRKLAASLTAQAAPALENAILYEELREQERIKRELEIAREVQRKLLPVTMPSCNGYAFDAVCLPALEVGGDYYDFFELSDNKLGVVVADVSGKGTSAAFYMAEIKGMMSTLANICHSPAQLLNRLNERLYISFDKNLFATMIYGVLDPDDSSFRFVRAGHNSLLHVSVDGRDVLVTPPGIGLGLDRGTVFREAMAESLIKLQSGDKLLLFTDGIIEAMNSDRKEFGEDRLQDLVKRNVHLGAAALKECIISEIKAFAGHAAQHDDLTMLIIDVKSQQNP